MRSTLSMTICIACIALPAKTHEFWIDTVDYQIEPGEAIVADLRVGTEYEGSSQSFIPRRFERFQYALNGQELDVPGILGDRPAANFPVEDEGLVVVVHQTTDLSVTWSTWEKFQNFVVHKDADWVLSEHEAEGLEKDGVREVYSRYAKSLIAVGAGEGSDVTTGMLTELVALENPYTDDLSDGFAVSVLYEGKPREDTQVEIFQRAPDGTVEISTVKTDQAGVALVPVLAGHEYMLDSVVLRRTDKASDAGEPYVWESLWANLTFEVPTDAAIN
ncbi:DUF4198 domain-containing protein [Rhodobacteraceae bacterium]|nr:DUF4198 domain-containing protein [Paracoccaceae bacterium]